MTFEEYQGVASRTRSGDADVIVAALGMAGESGEFADHVKKWLAQGHDLDMGKLILEAGDVLWYLSLFADWAGVTLGEIAEANIRKLRERYPEGFTPEASREREA